MAATHTRNTRGSVLKSWAIPAQLHPNESISSWLARTALLQGCDPLVLSGSIWPGVRVWTMDIDRGLNAEHLQALSLNSGIDIKHFEKAALRTDVEKIVGLDLPNTGSWPWVLALGARNRRRLGGLQFCPICLTEDVEPYFRKQWRFSWHTACAKHDLSLVDKCAVCEAPIAPHQLVAEDKKLNFCSRCRTDLRGVSALPADHCALAFQNFADQTLASGVGMYGQEVVTRSDWFAVARFYTKLVKATTYQKTSKLALALLALGIDIDWKKISTTGLPLELLSTSERVELLGTLQKLMRLGVEPFFTALNEHKISYNSLASLHSPLPTPLSPLLGLPSNRKRIVSRTKQRNGLSPSPEASVRKAWARLQRKIKAGPI